MDAANAYYSSVDGVLFNKSKTVLVQYPAGKGGSYAIPTGVTSIASSAFGNCTGLTSVAIPSSVTSIGSFAFYCCTALTNTTFLGNAPNIAQGVFDNTASGFTIYYFNGASGFTSPTWMGYPTATVTIPYTFTADNGTITITGYTGPGGAVSIPGTIMDLLVTGIGNGAFYNCTGLTSVTIPSSVTGIGIAPFDSCAALTAITVAAANANYASLDGVLFNKAQTTLIQYPGGMAGSYTIPSSVTTIERAAFSSCTGLTSVTIPSSVTSIGGFAFPSCTKLTAITVAAANANYASLDGVLFNQAKTALIHYPAGKTGAYSIPSGVTSIGDVAFYNSTGLTSVSIPSGVTSIGSYAFSGCPGLTSVNIPSSVTYIGQSAFEYCTGLTSVTISDGVTMVEWSAFYGCTSLTSVTIPASVTYIGGYAFQGCASLTSASFLGNAPLSLGAFDSTASGFTVYYFDGRSGFTSPTWLGYPAVNMGAATPLATWLVGQGLPYNANLEDDPNGDGVNLLLAYALNLDPKQNLSASMPKPVIDKNKLKLDFFAGNAAVTYAVETSTDLLHWTTQGVSVSGPDANQVRTATVDMNGSQRYMRLVLAH